jgi:hypothetical protein
MAAIAILSIWYVIIADAAIQGLRAQGENRRRLEASLIADKYLADQEAIALGDSVPEDQENEEEEEGFTIRIVVEPFDKGGGAAAALSALNPASSDSDATPKTLRPLLAKEAPGAAANLKTIRVTVSWEEGPVERSVERRTYVFDRAKATEAYASGARLASGDQDPRDP